MGQFAGENALAAVGASYSFTTVFIMIAIGGGMGASVLTIQYLGADRYGKMCTSDYTFLIAFGVSSVILAILGLLIFSSILNIVMDLLMVGGFHMGVEGAAIATVIAQGISAVLSLIIFLRLLKTYENDEKHSVFDMQMLKTGTKIAIPSIVQQSIVSVGRLLTRSLSLSGSPWLRRCKSIYAGESYQSCHSRICCQIFISCPGNPGYLVRHTAWLVCKLSDFFSLVPYGQLEKEKDSVKKDLQVVFKTI